MRHEKQRISLIANELINFFFMIGSTDISIQIKELDEKFLIDLSCNYLPEKRSRIDDFIHWIQSPRQVAMEEYYWELLGSSDLDTEISIIGMMVESTDISFDENTISVTLVKEKISSSKKKQRY